MKKADMFAKQGVARLIADYENALKAKTRAENALMDLLELPTERACDDVRVTGYPVLWQNGATSVYASRKGARKALAQEMKDTGIKGILLPDVRVWQEGVIYL